MTTPATIAAKTVSLTGYRGTIEAHVGDQFSHWDGTRWEIAAFTGDPIYSPSGFGGCPTVICRHLSGELTGTFKQYTVNGLCDWCGDSVASELIAKRDGIGRYPQEQSQ